MARHWMTLVTIRSEAIMPFRVCFRLDRGHPTPSSGRLHRAEPHPTQNGQLVPRVRRCPAQIAPKPPIIASNAHIGLNLHRSLDEYLRHSRRRPRFAHAAPHG